MATSKDTVPFSEDFHRTLLDLLPLLVSQSNTEGEWQSFSSSWLAYRGTTLLQEQNGSWLAGVHEDDALDFRRLLDETLTSRNPLTTEFRFQRHDGVYRWMSCWVHPHTTQEGVFDGFLAALQDIDDQKEALHALHQSEERLNSMLENSVDFIVTLDREDRYEYINRMADGMKREDLIGASVFDVVMPEDHDRLRAGIKQVWATGEPYEYESTWLDPENELRSFWSRVGPVLKDGEITAVTISSNDITQRKREEKRRQELDAQLQHSQKLESLGVLAGGIAHDFNNLLVSILGYTELTLLEHPEDTPTREKLEEIEKGAQRAADLASQMLAYSGKARFELSRINLNELVEEIAQLLEVSISKNVTLEYNFASDLALIEGDSTQIRQVIMNLITNASESMLDQEGALSLTSGILDCEADYFHDIPGAAHLDAGAYVYLDVADDGCGMDKATQEKIFDPFFTTKFTGRGLGMAAVQGIMAGHYGAIALESEVGHGSTFRVLFPASDGALHRWSPGGTVLIVDDEDSVRAVSKVLLEKLGFTVLEAANGQEAVRIFREYVDRISCVVLDFTMPKMNGDECLKKLRVLNKHIPVVMMSGYDKEDMASKLANLDRVEYVQKPFRIASLRAKLRNVLET